MSTRLLREEHPLLQQAQEGDRLRFRFLGEFGKTKSANYKHHLLRFHVTPAYQTSERLRSRELLANQEEEDRSEVENDENATRGDQLERGLADL